jgi:hypothetical protein
MSNDHSVFPNAAVVTLFPDDESFSWDNIQHGIGDGSTVSSFARLWASITKAGRDLDEAFFRADQFVPYYDVRTQLRDQPEGLELKVDIV